MRPAASASNASASPSRARWMSPWSSSRVTSVTDGGGLHRSLRSCGHIMPVGRLRLRTIRRPLRDGIGRGSKARSRSGGRARHPDGTQPLLQSARGTQPALPRPDGRSVRRSPGVGRAGAGRWQRRRGGGEPRGRAGRDGRGAVRGTAEVRRARGPSRRGGRVRQGARGPVPVPRGRGRRGVRRVRRREKLPRDSDLEREARGAAISQAAPVRVGRAIPDRRGLP